MPSAACNGVALHYERVGDGPRLLYCNGSGTTLDSTRPLLDKLAAQFELLAFDYRGMGRSAPVTEPYAMADVAISELGTDRVLFSADYPYESMAEAAQWFDNALIAESDRRKIGRRNAARLLHLDN